MPRMPFALAAVALLAACGSDNREAGGVTPAEAEALDQAAEMLESERLPVEAIPPPVVPPQPAGERSPPPAQTPGG